MHGNMTNLIIHDQDADGALEEINSALSAGGLEIRINTEQLSLVINALNELTEEGEYARSEVRLPSFPPGMIGMMVPSSFYHVNVKRASLWTVAILLDAWKTSGVATGLIAAHGGLKTAMCRVSPETGEYCNYMQAVDIQQSETPINTDSVAEKIINKPCPFPQVGCTHFQSNKCGISKDAITENLSVMEQKGALVSNNRQLKVPL